MLLKKNERLLALKQVGQARILVSQKLGRHQERGPQSRSLRHLVLMR
ncbi:hypothetical protein SynWH8101_1429 [Synechococcus sp. WH 8101]|nr:hypothetical protein SynWH8101_1429 [Synechococcus sp. WH 8101]QNI45244.1 hypothetical protein SynRCC2555_01461 [Synechococcus sp. WH 8101]